MNDSESDRLEKERDCVESNFCNIQAVERSQNESAFRVIVKAYQDLFNLKVDDEDHLRRPGSAMM